MRTLGVDPGTAATGYGVVDGEPGRGDTARLLAYGTIRTAPDHCMPERLASLHRELSDLICRWRPDAMAVEELFFARNVTNALTVGQARGVVLLSAGLANVPCFEYKPKIVKLSITGYGAADKRQVQDMLRLLLALSEPPRPDDAADAVAVALCHMQTARFDQMA